MLCGPTEGLCLPALRACRTPKRQLKIPIVVQARCQGQQHQVQHRQRTVLCGQMQPPHPHSVERKMVQPSAQTKQHLQTVLHHNNSSSQGRLRFARVSQACWHQIVSEVPAACWLTMLTMPAAAAVHNLARNNTTSSSIRLQGSQHPQAQADQARMPGRPTMRSSTCNPPQVCHPSRLLQHNSNSSNSRCSYSNSRSNNHSNSSTSVPRCRLKSAMVSSAVKAWKMSRSPSCLSSFLWP